MRDVGPDVVDFVSRGLAVDTRWSTREPRGFTWWSHRLAQRVWADPVHESGGVSLVRVHAEAALARRVPAGHETANRLSWLNGLASLSALLWRPGAGRVTLTGRPGDSSS